MSANLTLRILSGGTGNVTKNAPLTNSEMDQNMINLDNEIDTKASVEYVDSKTIADAVSMSIALG